MGMCGIPLPITFSENVLPIPYPPGGRIFPVTPVDTSQQQPDDFRGHPPIPCDAYESALHSQNGHSISFLLVDQLTLPLVGCEDHLEQSTAICGLTTEDTAELLSHRPAGGINCPSCRLAPYNLQQPLIPVEHGVVAVLACPDHQAEIVERFRTGIETQQTLTASTDTLQ